MAEWLLFKSGVIQSDTASFSPCEHSTGTRRIGERAYSCVIAGPAAVSGEMKHNMDDVGHTVCRATFRGVELHFNTVETLPITQMRKTACVSIFHR